LLEGNDAILVVRLKPDPANCPDPACVLFVADERRRDRAWVADTEELLKFEEP
jgi:hypothetical protein